MGIKNLQAGIGCGVGVGHGFGLGVVMRDKEIWMKDVLWFFEMYVCIQLHACVGVLCLI